MERKFSQIRKISMTHRNTPIFNYTNKLFALNLGGFCVEEKPKKMGWNNQMSIFLMSYEFFIAVQNLNFK